MRSMVTIHSCFRHTEARETNPCKASSEVSHGRISDPLVSRASNTPDLPDGVKSREEGWQARCSRNRYLHIADKGYSYDSIWRAGRPAGGMCEWATGTK